MGTDGFYVQNIASAICYLQGGFVGNLSIIPDSAPFSVSADGSVRVKDSAALDRESHTSFLFQVPLHPFLQQQQFHLNL